MADYLQVMRTPETTGGSDRSRANGGGSEHQHRLALLGTLTSGISHEFNNILTPVLAYAEMAQMNLGDAELVRKALERIVMGITQATNISEAILGLAAGSASGIAAGRADVRECAETALRCLARDPAKDGIRVSLEIPTGLCVGITSVALNHVLLNMIVNARRAMSTRGGRLTIQAKRDGSTGNDRLIQIVVEDTGCGIQPGFLPHIFDDFFSRTDDSTAPGRGLGLAICHRLISQAGGSVSVCSAVGKGTRFEIQLPALASSIAAKAA